MAFLQYVLLLVFLELVVSQSGTEENDTAAQDKDRCAQLAQFTPNLCDNDVAKERCTEQCGENGKLASKTLIYRNLYSFCEKMKSLIFLGNVKNIFSYGPL